MSALSTGKVSAVGSAQQTLRRLILYTLLFALVTLTAAGLTGLLEYLFSSGDRLVSRGVAELARALTFTLIGGPLAILLWRVVWKRLEAEAERAATGWGIYIAGMYSTALIASATAVLSTAASLVGSPDSRWYPPLASGLTWALVGLWHGWMWRHPLKHPRKLRHVPAVVGSVFGLLLGAGAAITSLGGVLDVALRGYESLTLQAEPWWQGPLRALVWSAGGFVIWWWHWIRGGVPRLQSRLVDVALVGFGILSAGAAALSGAGVSLFVLLRLALDRRDPLSELLEPLGPAIAAAAVGSLVWRYHRTIAAGRPEATVRAGRLATSAVALSAAASGIGVIINASLAMAVSPLAGSGTRTLLLAGISSLIVGGVAWWGSWQPARQPQTPEAVYPGRRIYLTAFFGLSAIVAIIALLVVGYRVFEFLLGDVSGGSLVDRIRGSLGLLVAAGGVAGYHFTLWRRERDMVPTVAPARPPAIKQITLVSGLHAEELRQAVMAETGAAVTVWKRADAESGTPPVLSASEANLLIRRITDRLAGLAAEHVLLLVGTADDGSATVDAIALQDSEDPRP